MAPLAEPMRERSLPLSRPVTRHTPRVASKLLELDELTSRGPDNGSGLSTPDLG